jgi:hypothetical protein
MAIVVPILSEWNPKGLDRAMADVKKAEGGLAKFQAGLKGLAIPATIGFGAVVLGSKQAIDAASDMQQSFGALDAVFKDSSKEMQNWAKQQSNIGLSTADAADAAAYFGAMLKGAGIPLKDASKQSKTLTGLAADMAATFGGTTSDAVTALAATLRGEYDSIEKFGVSLKQSDVNARLASTGQDKLTGEALKNAEAQARLALIMEKTTDVQGQFARESDTVAARQQQMAAETENAKAAIGEGLLPIMEKILPVVTDFAKFVGKNADLVSKLAIVFGVLTGAVLLLNIAMNANPISLIIIGIGLLIAALVVAYEKFDVFRKIVDVIWDVMKGFGNFIKNVIVAYFNLVVDVIEKIIGLIKKLKDGFSTIGSALSSLNPFAKGATFGVTGTVAPMNSRATGSPTAKTSSAGASMVMSEEMVARALANILSRSDLRNGRTIGFA